LREQIDKHEKQAQKMPTTSADTDDVRIQDKDKREDRTHLYTEVRANINGIKRGYTYWMELLVTS
jgi:hypothetical protein